MSELMIQSLVPLPQVAIHIRPGTMEDLPFMDGLQKKTTRQVGWMPTKQLEGKVKAGQVLVAERQFGVESLAFGVEDREEVFSTPNSKPQTSNLLSLGYLIGHDQYFKRDDVGIIYQINVAPEYRRSLVAASLLKAQFERSAYGCKLYCCWCAQDIEANRFWEAMGFVALAFRAGSEKRARVHIFWQKRIRAGDETTPWWFPAKTDGGALRADRIVLPIPPGTRWEEEMPLILPEDRREPALSKVEGLREESGERKARRAGEGRGRTGKGNPQPEPVKRRFVQFSPPGSPQPVVEPEPVEAPKVREKKPKVKTDPKLVAAARELRDRWLERVNEDPSAIASHGKYDVSRAIAASGRPALLAA